jgi:hypothetical protein
VVELFDRRFDRVDAEMLALRVEIRELRRDVGADIRGLHTEFNQLRFWLLGVMLTMALAIAGAYVT